MIFCFFKKLIQLLMMQLSGKMILKAKSCGVLICFISCKNLFIRNKLSDSDGCILILDVDIDGSNFILINLYNSNTKAEQLKTLLKLTEMLNKLHLIKNNNIICAGDFKT